MGFFKEFKEFASKGSLVEIAVAFVMGAAFGKIVSAFTDGIVSPLIGFITGGVNFNDKQTVLKESTLVKDASGAVISGDPGVVLKWGQFVTATIDFIIVAFAMFLIIKAINSMKKKEIAAAAPLTTTEVLLMEIRDSLKR
ncbi:MAG: large conductance mechanosensitive channel protein MscL [Bacteroidota bacterium]